MRKALTDTVKHALFVSGYYTARLRRDRFPGVAVLCYHAVRDDRWPAGTMASEGLHVRASELEAHCKLLRACCDPIGLAECRAARTGSPLPPRPVLVTFDDGYRSVFTLARPILQRFGIPAVLFVCSDPVERRELFWHDALQHAGGQAAVQRAKRAPFADWQVQRQRWARVVPDDDPHAPLTVPEVCALAATPGIEIAAHTLAHPILANASGAEQQIQIQQNKAQLERWIGRPVTAFAYPNGQPCIDYTAQTVDVVRASGFEFAFTTRSDFARADGPILELPRFVMLSDVSAAELAHRLCHSWRQ